LKLKNKLGYNEYKNKHVSQAAKSLINLYREENPKLLEKKFRGKDTEGLDDDKEVLKFG
jgi:hypothetical protein